MADAAEYNDPEYGNHIKRIVAFADIYDALRSERPCKPAFDHEKTLGIMLDGDGRTMPRWGWRVG